jgi:hypothetical protein
MPAKITWEEVLEREEKKTLIGGYLDVLCDGLIYRASISSLDESDNCMVFGFRWRAWSDPCSPDETTWTMCDGKSLSISKQFQPYDIGQWKIRVSTLNGEVTIFPKGTLTLGEFDPATALGLEL